MVYSVEQIAQRVLPVAQKYGLKAVYLFGSYARGTAGEKSDIDLLIDTTGTNIKSLLSFSAVYCDLEDALQKQIDLITVSSLEQRPQMETDVRFREAVLKERVNLYILNLVEFSYIPCIDFSAFAIIIVQGIL